MRDWISQEADRSKAAVLEEVRGCFEDSPRRLAAFEARFDLEYERIFRLMHSLYGWRWDFSWRLIELVRVAATAAADRPKWLRRRDETMAGARWMNDPATVWAMTYTERFAGTVAGISERVEHLKGLGVTHLHLMPPYAVPDGPNDGGYAVSSYRWLRPELGDMSELKSLARSLDDQGMSLVLDFVANHTAHDHPWAEAAKRGEAPYDRFYFIFDDRAEVAGYAPHLREIFPDRVGDAFTWCPDAEGSHGGKWVWTTFYPFQWDLDYRNPAVLVAMSRELLHIANLGASVIRMDATPFLWKREGTSCENLPEAHVVLQLMNAVAALTAPSVRFLSEAIVHPDDVHRFVRPDECALGYNPLVMSLIWEAMATREAGMLAAALEQRLELPPGCQWITYIRSHDDIGWGFADEDAAALGIDPVGHRRFLNEFYAGIHEGSFARGAFFQANPRTGDARISGTLASLAGLEAAVESADPDEIEMAVKRIIAIQTLAFTTVGIPMLYLGDEVGTTNDHRFGDDTDHAGDNRWMHRPRFDAAAVAEAVADPSSPGGRILAAVRRLSAFRSSHAALGGGTPRLLDAGHPAVAAFTRAGGGEMLLVAVNVSDFTVEVDIDSGGWPWVDVEEGTGVVLRGSLAPYGVVMAEAPSPGHAEPFAPGEVG
ncbi:MAG: alpha-amylase family glycosyl hydrolase [Acidimicrobiia bacterium]